MLPDHCFALFEQEVRMNDRFLIKWFDRNVLYFYIVFGFSFIFELIIALSFGVHFLDEDELLDISVLNEVFKIPLEVPAIQSGVTLATGEGAILFCPRIGWIILNWFWAFYPGFILNEVEDLIDREWQKSEAYFFFLGLDQWPFHIFGGLLWAFYWLRLGALLFDFMKSWLRGFWSPFCLGVRLIGGI